MALLVAAENQHYQQRPFHCSNDMVSLLVKSNKEKERIIAETLQIASLTLTVRQLCDVEMLLNGGFTPLRGFLNEDDYNSVVQTYRLANGNLWPMPITLDISESLASKLSVGDRLALRDIEGALLAVLEIESKWKPNKALEAEKVFGSPDDTTHPAIEYLLTRTGDYYVGGTLIGVNLPTHFDFTENRLTPLELRELIRSNRWENVVFFQTRNPMHRSHVELTMRAARDANANVIVHPVVGASKPGDVDYFTRVKCYREIMRNYPRGSAELALLPLAMRMGGPREALWHAIIRKNYGATHFIIGRDHAGPGNNRHGKPFYGIYDAHTLVKQHSEEIGIQILSYQEMVYVQELDDYRTIDDIPTNMTISNISGTELRRRLHAGAEIPAWFSYPNVVAILRKSYPPRDKAGFTVFFTGLSGSGKSTIAKALLVALQEDGRRAVTLLDGDKVRQFLSSELGFSKEHRDLNIRRISYVSSAIAKSGGVSIVAAIAPYRNTRDYGRRIVNKSGGGFIEIFVATPLEECEKRDPKGLYKKARSGLLKKFTGIDDPYEPPISPEISIDTSNTSVKQAVQEILLYLEKTGYLPNSNTNPIQVLDR